MRQENILSTVLKILPIPGRFVSHAAPSASVAAAAVASVCGMTGNIRIRDEGRVRETSLYWTMSL